jgi:uncharacterized membrane protein YfcA
LFSLATAQQTCQLSSAADGTATSDCPTLYQCVQGVCTHKDLFPLSPIEIVGLVLVVFITGLASSGGNGGGTILTPILLIFFHYSESNAIMIVYSMIFGGAIGNFINTGRKRNSKTGKPYLNWDLALICMPPMLLGTSLGIILNRVVAPIVVVVGLVALTVYTLTRVSKKARSEYAKESENRREDKLLAEEGLLNSFSESTDIDQSFEELNNENLEDDRLFPPIKVAKVLGILFFMVLLSLFRGTLNFHSLIGLSYCGIGYWLCLLVGVFVCIICFYFNQKLIREQIKLKQTLRYNSFIKEDEFQIKPQHISRLLILSLIAGILAGMFGIGGGTVMSPTLLGLGIKAQALSATSGFFVLQTSFISLIAALLYGEVPPGVMGFFLVVSCIGAFGVSWGINRLVKRYQRPSIILISLLFVYALSLVATPTYEFIKNADHMGNLFIFNDVCK